MLHINDISVRYSDNEHPVIQDLNLSANEGEITTILGPTGSGKSTVLHTLAGVLPKDLASISGQIVLDGDNLTLPLRWANPIGIAFQKPTFFSWLSAKENVLAFHRYSNTKSRSIVEVERFVDFCFELYGLKDAINKRPHALSGGMLARLNVIRAISFKPRLLLLDETLSNLDEIIRSKILQHLVDFTRENKLITLMVTHNLNDALEAQGRVEILSGEPINKSSTWNMRDATDVGSNQECHQNLKQECERLWYR